jgi:Na+/phosphate symporter
MITLNVRYRELCAIKHALDERVNKKISLLTSEDEKKEKLLKEIVEEKKLIENLEKKIEANRQKSVM